MENVQSILAIVIVLGTAGIILRGVFAKKKPGCGAGCGCDSVTKKFPSPKKK